MANFQLQDVQKVPYAILLTDADGNAVSPAPGDSASTPVSSAPGSMTVAPDATPDPAKAPAGSVPLATGFFLGGKTPATGVTGSSTITFANGAPSVTIVDTLDIVTGPAVNASINLGTPVAQ